MGCRSRFRERSLRPLKDRRTVRRRRGRLALHGLKQSQHFLKDKILRDGEVTEEFLGTQGRKPPRTRARRGSSRGWAGAALPASSPPHTDTSSVRTGAPNFLCVKCFLEKIRLVSTSDSWLVERHTSQPRGERKLVGEECLAQEGERERRESLQFHLPAACYHGRQLLPEFNLTLVRLLCSPEAKVRKETVEAARPLPPGRLCFEGGHFQHQVSLPHILFSHLGKARRRHLPLCGVVTVNSKPEGGSETGSCLLNLGIVPSVGRTIVVLEWRALLHRRSCAVCKNGC